MKMRRTITTGVYCNAYLQEDSEEQNPKSTKKKDKRNPRSKPNTETLADEEYQANKKTLTTGLPKSDQTSR